LVPDAGSANTGAKTYVRDLCEGIDAPAGCAPHTEIASINSHDAPISGNFAAISNDGRFVAFTSADAPELHVRDTCTGNTATSACETTTAAFNLNGAVSQSGQPLTMSADGRYMAVVVSIPIVHESPQSSILLVDTCEGIDAPADCVLKTTVISIAPDGSAFAGNSEVPAMSGDGRFVAFEVASAAPDADSGTNTTQVFLRDTCSGATASNGCLPSTALISSAASSPSISSSGRYVSYVGINPSTGVSGTSETFSPYVYDTCFGSVAPCTPNAYLAASVNVQTGIVIPVSSDGSLAAVASKDALGSLPFGGLGDVYEVSTSH